MIDFTINNKSMTSLKHGKVILQNRPSFPMAEPSDINPYIQHKYVSMEHVIAFEAHTNVEDLIQEFRDILYAIPKDSTMTITFSHDKDWIYYGNLSNLKFELYPRENCIASGVLTIDYNPYKYARKDTTLRFTNKAASGIVRNVSNNEMWGINIRLPKTYTYPEDEDDYTEYVTWTYYFVPTRISSESFFLLMTRLYESNWATEVSDHVMYNHFTQERDNFYKNIDAEQSYFTKFDGILNKYKYMFTVRDLTYTLGNRDRLIDEAPTNIFYYIDPRDQSELLRGVLLPDTLVWAEPSKDDTIVSLYTWYAMNAANPPTENVVKQYISRYSHTVGVLEDEIDNICIQATPWDQVVSTNSTTIERRDIHYIYSSRFSMLPFKRLISNTISSYRGKVVATNGMNTHISTSYGSLHYLAKNFNSKFNDILVCDPFDDSISITKRNMFVSLIVILSVFGMGDLRDVDKMLRFSIKTGLLRDSGTSPSDIFDRDVPELSVPYSYSRYTGIRSFSIGNIFTHKVIGTLKGNELIILYSMVTSDKNRFDLAVETYYNVFGDRNITYQQPTKFLMHEKVYDILFGLDKAYLDLEELGPSVAAALIKNNTTLNHNQQASSTIDFVDVGTLSTPVNGVIPTHKLSESTDVDVYEVGLSGVSKDIAPFYIEAVPQVIKKLAIKGDVGGGQRHVISDGEGIIAKVQSNANRAEFSGSIEKLFYVHDIDEQIGFNPGFVLHIPTVKLKPGYNLSSTFSKDIPIELTYRPRRLL